MTRELADPYDLPDAAAYLEDPYDSPGGALPRPTRGEDLIKRDKRGRPYVMEIDEDGALTGREITYTRVTKFIDCVDDRTFLVAWGERKVAAGLVIPPRGERFRSEVAARLGDDQARDLDRVIVKIKEAAGAEDRAAVGTATHVLSERHDLGLPIGPLDSPEAEDLAAYVEATKYLRMVEVERFVVCDELGTAGTPDRIVEYGEPCPECGLTYYIFDLKTGQVRSYTRNVHAMQLAIYSRSKFYDLGTGEREPLPPVCQHRGIVCALPAHTGEATLIWVDLTVGWELAQIAAVIRASRRKRAGHVPFVARPTLMWRIRQVSGENPRAELNALRAENRSEWTEIHTAAGWERLKELGAS